MISTIFAKDRLINKNEAHKRINHKFRITMSHHVSTVFNQGMSFTSSINDHKIVMDSHDNPAEETGPSPKRLMLAALAGCTGIDIVSILNKMKVEFSDFSIDITASLSDDHPKIYKEVKILYKIMLAEKDRPKMEKAIHLSQNKYCGVSAMFRTFAKIDTETWYL